MPVLNFYASHETTERAAETFKRDLAGYSLLSPQAEKCLNFKMHHIQPLGRFTIGTYSVMAFPANHAPGMGAMLYSIEANGRAVFYGTDTASLFEQTWQAFRALKIRFDAVILDHNPNPSRVSTCSVSVRLNAEQNSIPNSLSAASTILSCDSLLSAPSAGRYRTVSPTLHTAVFSHSISIGPASAATTSGFLLAA